MAQKTIHLIKEYERDVSLVVEDLWARKLPSSIENKLNIRALQSPFSVFYATEENLQIWENKKAIEWYRDQLLAKNREGTKYIREVIDEYAVELEPIKNFWKKGATSDISALKTYVKHVEKASELFSLWYYPVSDERTPENVKILILPLRNSDEFFAHNDVYIKGCVELLGGDPKFANLIYPDEFPDLPSEQVLKDRAKGDVSVDGDNHVVIELSKFAVAHPEYYFEGLDETAKNVKEFKGQIAERGKITGRVRIVKNKFQMQKVRVGEILVSPMTTPDFLPAMNRAAAFVTNEGGVICHAAIVARELKKPCIIGTKIATKVLKDGDIVEVDAERGIVKILKRSSEKNNVGSNKRGKE